MKWLRTALLLCGLAAVNGCSMPALGEVHFSELNGQRVALFVACGSRLERVRLFFEKEFVDISIDDMGSIGADQQVLVIPLPPDLTQFDGPAPRGGEVGFDSGLEVFTSRDGARSEMRFSLSGWRKWPKYPLVTNQVEPSMDQAIEAPIVSCAD